jgi:hydrogenase expression/formation protein HypE
LKGITMSKFSLDVLQRCVFPFVGADEPGVGLGAAFGEDVALTQVGDDILVSHVDPIVGAVADIGWLAVHVACNDVATTGVRPRWVLMLVLMPRMDDETLLEQIMRDAHRAAKELGVAIVGGHTGYTSSLSRPLVAVTALGTAGKRAPVLSSGAKVGDHVLVTKVLAVEGTAILAQDFADIAERLGLSAEERSHARQLMGNVSVVPEALTLAEHGATAMHDVTRGGLLETLLEIAQLSSVGIEVDTAQLPIAPIVARFADAFQFDPLRMISSGTLAATVPVEQLPAASEALRELGVPFNDIGQVVAGGGVRLLDGTTATECTDVHCEEDELARLWELYPRDG